MSVTRSRGREWARGRELRAYQLEHLEDLLLGVLLAHLAGHHLEELGELNGARAVGVNVGDHLLELLLLDLEAEGAHGGLELAVVNVAGVISIEEVEGLADLLDLLLGESGLLRLTTSTATGRHD